MEDESDGSATSFSDTESEPEYVGYVSKRTSKMRMRIAKENEFSTGQRWMLGFLMIFIAFFVMLLCVYGDAKQIDTSEWHADQVIEGLHIGGYIDALNADQMKKLGITHVLSIALGAEPRYPDQFRYMVVKAQDKSDQDLLSYFPVMQQFIDEGRKNGSVLVHCMHGQSRSAMVVTGYLMKTFQWTAPDALEFLHKARPQVKPRRAFLEQLTLYYQYKGRYDGELPEKTNNWPNKAQIALWPFPEETKQGATVRNLPQPPWIELEFWREWWDFVVHHYMDFYNRYLRYYAR